MNYKTLVAAMGAAVMTVAAGNAGAATKFWTGGGSDDNLSTAANWSDGVAPASGDALVFAGNVRTTPYNDYDPETTSFTSLVFSNTCATAETSAPFTLSGNKIVLTCGTSFSSQVYARGEHLAVFTAGVPNTAKSIEDVIACDVTLNATGRFGANYAARHNLRFTGTVTAAAPYELATYSQMYGAVTFDGPVKGFSHVVRPNGGGGSIVLKSSENSFTSSAPAHNVYEGILRFDSVAAGGGSAMSLSIGQIVYNTIGILEMNADEDTEISGSITVRGDLAGNYGYKGLASGRVHNLVAGTTLTLSGDLCPIKTGASGVMVQFGGAGDGVFSGAITDACLFVEKAGTGTWTLTNAGAMTNAVKVTAGKLCVNGDWSTAQGSSVKSGATLCGTGKLGDVTFENGAGFAVASTDSLLHIAALTLNGTVTVAAPSVALSAGTHDILTFDAESGTGAFTLGAGWPAGATVALGEKSVAVTVPSAVLTWTGATDANWDFATANWADGKLFSTGDAVSFDDTATVTDVVLAGVMQPTSVSVSGTKNWTFSGEGIGGSAAISKSGAGVLTLAGAHGYTGLTKIDGGALVVEGTLSGTSISVGSGAALTNATTSRLTGSGAVICEGPASLAGVNEMTGGLTLCGKTTTVEGAGALGAGDVTLKSSVTLNGGGDCGAGKTLTIAGTTKLTVQRKTPATSFAWCGDVDMAATFELYNNSGVVTFGREGGSTCISTGSNKNLNLVLRGGSSVYHFYSRLDVRGCTRIWMNDGNTTHLYASGNAWNTFDFSNGRLVCHAADALSPDPIKMGAQYADSKTVYAFNPILDLNGFDQTISALVMNDSTEDCSNNKKSSQTITSETPATLTVKNDADTLTRRMQCVVTNAVTLCKKGAGAWTFAGRNASTGNVEVVEGTFIPASADSLPTGRYSTLFVTPGAKVAVTNAINVTVPYLVYNGKHLPRGVYCGTGGASGTVNTDIFADGVGTLTVSRGKGGMMLIVR